VAAEVAVVVVIVAAVVVVAWEGDIVRIFKRIRTALLIPPPLSYSFDTSRL
jgi:hypothetical protein